MVPSAERALMFKRLDERPNTQKIVRVFHDVNMQNSHPGLAEIASKQGVDVYKLKVGEYVVFINTQKTALKMFSTGNMIAYLRMPGTQRLDISIVAQIPRFFNGRAINYTDALKEKLTKEFAKKGQRVKIEIEGKKA